jgi:hypothetical protein
MRLTCSTVERYVKWMKSFAPKFVGNRQRGRPVYRWKSQVSMMWCRQDRDCRHAVVNKVMKWWNFLTRRQTSNFATSRAVVLAHCHAFRKYALLYRTKLCLVFSYFLCVKSRQMDALCPRSAVTEYLSKTTLSYSISRVLSSWHCFINIVNNAGSNHADPLGCYTLSTNKQLLTKASPWRRTFLNIYQ